MKKLFLKTLFVFSFLGIVIFSCKRECISNNDNYTPGHAAPLLSKADEFKQGISTVVNLIQQYQIVAYLDTLPNGFPNKQGRKTSLAQFGYAILEKLQGGQLESAVYDVFHFDGATFSLISYIMKAQMVGDISAQTLATIISLIPLPPVANAAFQAPVIWVPGIALGGDCCDHCEPKINILVTWTYKAPCGNYEKKTSGYAANNTLSHMSGGKIYRFDVEVTGCDCPYEVSSDVEVPAGAQSYGIGKPSKSSVTVFPVSSGTYKVTFTVKVCGKEVKKTFTLGID